MKQMTIEHCGLFIVTLGAATLLPGPSVLLALHNGLLYSRIRCIAGVLGVVLAALILAVIAMTGLVGLLTASAHMFRLLRLAGAAYLIFLGIRMLWWARGSSLASMAERGTREVRARDLFHQGLRVGLSNPKAILFFAALFPQLIDTARGGALQYVVMLVTLVVVVFVCLMVYALGGRWLARRLGGRRFGSWPTRLTGAGYVSLGSCFALSRD
jgi:threonine/homoserine/homoserine lactone efflux protein